MKRRRVEIGCVVLLAVLAAFTLGFFLGSESSRPDVTVETVAEALPVPAEVVSKVPAEAASEAPAASGTEAPETALGRIDLNTATQEELETLPGIGPVLAGRILDYREAYGPFVTVEQIMEVEGVGEKRFEALKEWITVEETNENSGS